MAETEACIQYEGSKKKDMKGCTIEAYNELHSRKIQCAF